MKKILAAMSGGVDSAAACILLQRQGITVGGGTMLLRPGGEEEAQMAADAAAQLGLIFHLFCWQEEFLQNVIEPFPGLSAGRDTEPLHLLQPDDEIRPISGCGAGAGL